MDELFTIIGRLYIEVVQSQKVIENLQKKISTKDEEISMIEKSLNTKDSN